MSAYLTTQSGIGRLTAGGVLEILDCPYTDLGDALRAGMTVADAVGLSARETVDQASIVVRAPVLRPGKIVAIGLNYLEHISESGRSRPEHPVLFLKAPSSIIGPGEPIRLPSIAPSQVDYEGEVALVMGTRAKNIDAETAWDYVFGVTIANDVSARDVQLGLTGAKPNVSLAKSFDTFTPLGPRVVTSDALPDRDDIRISTYVNGEQRQSASTTQLLTSIPELVAHASKHFTLCPGDVILTGTPAGVGHPSGLYLQPGDLVSIHVAGIGDLVTPVIDE